MKSNYLSQLFAFFTSALHVRVRQFTKQDIIYEGKVIECPMPLWDCPVAFAQVDEDGYLLCVLSELPKEEEHA